MNETMMLDNAEYFKRIMIMFVFAISTFGITAKFLGQERKAKWFKKRTKYTLFTRRGLLGEYIHFGRPCTWEGVMVFTGIFSLIFSVGYFYIFCY